MGAIWFGIMLIMVSFVLGKISTGAKPGTNAKFWAWGARILGLLVIIGGLIASTVVTIPAGHRGVKMQFRDVVGTLPEGLHFIMPYVHTVEVMNVQTQKEESQASAASRDLQIVTTSVALNFHVDPNKVGELYERVGMSYKVRVIDPAVQESIKMVTAKYTAEQLITRRPAVKAEVEEDIARRLGVYDLVVEPGGLSITNFDFSPEFNQAIEKKQVAQQEAEQQKYVLQKAELERQTMVAQAKGEAESAKLRATALQSQGGSKVLAREWISKWDGHVPQVSGSGNGIILDINSLMKSQQ